MVSAIVKQPCYTATTKKDISNIFEKIFYTSHTINIEWNNHRVVVRVSELMRASASCPPKIKRRNNTDPQRSMSAFAHSCIYTKMEKCANRIGSMMDRAVVIIWKCSEKLRLLHRVSELKPLIFNTLHINKSFCYTATTKKNTYFIY